MRVGPPEYDCTTKTILTPTIEVHEIPAPGGDKTEQLITSRFEIVAAPEYGCWQTFSVEMANGD